MTGLSLGEQLYRDCFDALMEGKPGGAVRARGGVGAGSMVTMLVWNVVVAGLVHIAADIVYDHGQEWLRNLRKLLTDRFPPSKPPGDAPPPAVSVVTEFVPMIAEVGPRLAEARPTVDEASLESAIESAVPGIAQVLRDNGWQTDRVDAMSRRIAGTVADRLYTAAGWRGAAGPSEHGGGGSAG
jgi:hypothetical protein